MSLSHSPLIVTNGLVLYTDASNTKKSWLGGPTTNLANLSVLTGNSPNVVMTTVNDILPNGNYGAVNEFNCQIIADPNRTIGIGSFLLTSGVTYTLSFYVKNISCTGFGGNLYSPTSNVLGNITYPTVPVGVWTRVSTTFTIPSGYGSSFNLSPQLFRDGGIGILRIANVQLEVSGFATPYTSSSRTTTQNLVDITGNNLITANSLTYNSDGSFSFNGTSNYVTMPENAVFNTQTPSVEVWVKPNVLTQNGFFFEKGAVNTQYALFLEGANITWRQYLSGSLGSMLATSATYLNTSQYAQIVGTFTSGSRCLYVNGVLVASDAATGTFANNANGCSIGVYGGASGTNAYWFNGSIGSVKVYNRVLTASEVKQNFNALRGRYGI
jgi:hypothetical protein